MKIFFLIAVLGAGPVLAQSAEVDQALAAIRPEAIRAHMSFLADDLLEGRGTATILPRTSRPA